MESADTHLRYLDAARVDTPIGRLTRMTLLSPSDKPVGWVNGVIIDPLERQVRYFVVESRRWLTTRRYLFPLTPAPFDQEGLHVELEPEDLRRLPKFHRDRFPTISDEDLNSTFFSSCTA